MRWYGGNNDLVIIIYIIIYRDRYIARLKVKYIYETDVRAYDTERRNAFETNVNSETRRAGVGGFWKSCFPKTHTPKGRHDETHLPYADYTRRS